MAATKKKMTVGSAGARASFEDALSGLEDIAGRLESEELALDEALAVFEEGVGLMRVCDTHLRTARGQLAELTRGENGELVSQILGEDLESFTNANNQ